MAPRCLHCRSSLAKLGVCGLLVGLAAAAVKAEPLPEEGQPQLTAGLSLGDVVITGFSGTKLAVDGMAPGVHPIEKTVIDTDGASLRVFDFTAVSGPLAGQTISPAVKFQVNARAIGQVFGVAIGNTSFQGLPDIYAAATSAFGIRIVGDKADKDGSPIRLKVGAPGARFMNGQFGGLPGAGPGTIYKIEGATGVPTVFATVESGGLSNSGPGLGGLAYDPATNSIYVSDLDTGLVHRFSGASGATGQAVFDHGVTGRPANGRPTVPDDGQRMDITSSAFKPDDPATWGLAPPARRVTGLAVYNARLYYAVAEGPEIWSVSIASDGLFGADPRIETSVGTEKGATVTDMAFDSQGRMAVALRGATKNPFEFGAFAEPGSGEVMRFEPASLSEPSPTAWAPEPKRYAIGGNGDHRRGAGGVSFAYGYNADGTFNGDVCDGSLVASADAVQGASQPDAFIHGLQLNAAELVQPGHMPPAQSVFADFNGRLDGKSARGLVGGVEAYRDCRTSEPPPVVASTEPPVGYGEEGYPPVAGGGGGSAPAMGGGGPTAASDAPSLPGDGTAGGELPADTPAEPQLCQAGAGHVTTRGAGCTPNPNNPSTKFCQLALDVVKGDNRPVTEFDVALSQSPIQRIGVFQSGPFDKETAFAVTPLGDRHFKVAAPKLGPSGAIPPVLAGEFPADQPDPVATFAMCDRNGEGAPGGDGAANAGGAPMCQKSGAGTVTITKKECNPPEPGTTARLCSFLLDVDVKGNAQYFEFQTQTAETPGRFQAITAPIGSGDIPVEKATAVGSQDVGTNTRKFLVPVSGPGRYTVAVMGKFNSDDPALSVSTSDKDCEDPPPVPSALHVTKTTNGCVPLNDPKHSYQCDFDIEITNVGGTPFSGVVDVQDVPTNFFVDTSFVSGDFACPPGKAQCTSPHMEMAAGESKTIRVRSDIRKENFEFIERRPGDCVLVNEVTISSPDAQFDSRMATASGRLPIKINQGKKVECDPPALVLAKTAEDCIPTAAGFDCRYRLTVKSEGPDPFLDGRIEISEVLPEGATVAKYSLGWTCGGSGANAKCSQEHATLYVGESRSLDLTVSVPGKAVKTGQCEVKNEASVAKIVDGSARSVASAVAKIKSPECQKPRPIVAAPAAVCPAGYTGVYPKCAKASTCFNGMILASTGRCACPAGQAYDPRLNACAAPAVSELAPEIVPIPVTGGTNGNSGPKGVGGTNGSNAGMKGIGGTNGSMGDTSKFEQGTSPAKVSGGTNGSQPTKRLKPPNDNLTNAKDAIQDRNDAAQFNNILNEIKRRSDAMSVRKGPSGNKRPAPRSTGFEEAMKAAAARKGGKTTGGTNGSQPIAPNKKIGGVGAAAKKPPGAFVKIKEPPVAKPPRRIGKRPGAKQADPNIFYGGCSTAACAAAGKKPKLD